MEVWNYKTVVKALTLAGVVLYPLHAQRVLEGLDRGLVAVNTGNGNYISWRLSGDESRDLGFNLYRDGVKINSEEILGSTNFVDAAGSSNSEYVVKSVRGGVEKSASASVKPWGEITKRIPLNRPAAGSGYTYSPNDGSAGDLNGDGKWDLVLKWDPSNSQDNSKGGKTGNVYLDGMDLEGNQFWRIDLGQNIRAGAHYTQFVVADFDLDGLAEVICKTAPGTKDGLGNYLSKGPAANDDDGADYRNSSGYVLSGPEYLTVFSGQDGRELATVDYKPGRGTVSSWGDKYGNRVDRFLATAAWLDGVKPSAVMSRGYYTRMAVTAYDWDGTTLKERWYHNSATSGQGCYGQGNHSIAVGDIDSDGKDEIVQGGCALDDNGNFLYRTGFGHGDAHHLGDLIPSRPGLELFQVHEETGAEYGYEMHDALTGEVLWGAYTGTDNGRGMSADVDPNSEGYESWSFGDGNMFSATGQKMSHSRRSMNFRIYWDGNLQDELLDAIGSPPSPMKIESFVDGRLVSTDDRYGNYVGIANNSTKANPVLVADLFGDWREEMILRESGDEALILYTTTLPTEHKLYTLMHDPMYRASISWQNAGYNQPPHLGFWLGAGADKAPTPNIELLSPFDRPLEFSGNADFSVKENTQSVGILKALYGDGSQKSFQIVGGEDAASFELNEQTGELRFVFPQDFENPADQNKDGIYLVRVNVSDAGSTDEMDFRVQVENLEEPQTPFFLEAENYCEADGVFEDRNPGFSGLGYLNFTNEANTKGRFMIYSETGSPKTLRFRFANGGTENRDMGVSMNSVNVGALSFPSTTDWVSWQETEIEISFKQGWNELVLSAPGASGGPNLDVITSESAELYYRGCEVQPSLNLAPVFETGDSLRVDENQSVVGIIQVRDPENQPISFRLGEGSDTEFFAINSETGELSFINPPDYENPLDGGFNNIYWAYIIASDGSLETTQKTAIHLTDIVFEDLPTQDLNVGAMIQSEETFEVYTIRGQKLGIVGNEKEIRKELKQNPGIYLLRSQSASRTLSIKMIQGMGEK